MKIYEIGTGYTSIPAKMGAATEIVVEELTKAFLSIGQDVTLVDIADPNRLPNNLPIEEVHIPKVLTDTDVQLGIMHKLKRVVYSIALALKLKKMLSRTKEEVLLHFHNQYNMYFFLKLTGKSLRKKVKIAYTVHSYIWPGEWDEIKDTIKKRYFQEVYCVQHADYVLVLNDKTINHFVKRLHVPKNRIWKIANGVNTDIYSVLPDTEIENFKGSIGLVGKRMIFQVGSVCERKNQLGAVKMLSNYLRENKDVVYAYAGGIIDEEYKRKIDEYVKDENLFEQVVYVGEIAPGKTLNQYYNAANLTVFPSRIESFGLVIIESLSAGTPVLLGDKPLFDLNSGYEVFSNRDEFIRFVKENADGKNRGEKNRSEIIEKYSWKAVAREHLSIFENNWKQR